MPFVRQQFDQQLQQLRDGLLALGNVVEGMLGDATESLLRQDVALARKVVETDDQADELDLSIEADCMRLLALQQPMARDLRTIGTVLKAISDLERIGDYSVDIAKAVEYHLSQEPYFKPLERIQRIASLSKMMVRECLDAFVARDLELAQKVCRDDQAVDKIWHALLDELVEFMQRDPKVVRQAAHLLLVARYLERIADHATNVAERVYYMETGRLEQLARTHSAEAR